MAHMLIRHKVADFKKWKPKYEEHRGARQEAGLKDLHLWHNENQPNEVIVLFEASDTEKAKKFADSADLKEAMKSSGVQGNPEITILSED